MRQLVEDALDRMKERRSLLSEKRHFLLSMCFGT